jgi:hypothetical protein
MGLAIVVAGFIWRAGGWRRGRIAGFGLATAFATLATPLVRELPHLAALPDPLEAYLRPGSRYAAFTLFPWAGFLFAGGLVGELILAAGTPALTRRLQAGLAAAGSGGALLGWWASTQPALFPNAEFWTSSPTFFLIRLGIVTAIVPAGWAHCRFWLEGLRETEPAAGPGPWLRTAPVALTRAIETMGRSSLFVYWIHVEMVYGVIAEPIKKTLPLELSLVATVLLCAFLYLLVLGKNGLMQRFELPRPMRIFATVLR